MLERKVGTPLPPSYRAFLERHNGWGNFRGTASCSQSKTTSVSG